MILTSFKIKTDILQIYNKSTIFWTQLDMKQMGKPEKCIFCSCPFACLRSGSFVCCGTSTCTTGPSYLDAWWRRLKTLVLTSDCGDWASDSGRGCSPWRLGGGGAAPETWSGCETKRRSPGRPQPRCSDPHPVSTDSCWGGLLPWQCITHNRGFIQYIKHCLNMNNNSLQGGLTMNINVPHDVSDHLQLLKDLNVQKMKTDFQIQILNGWCAQT